MTSMRCDDCGAEMRNTGKLNSGNSVFREYRCIKCMNRKTICEGVVKA